MAFNSRRAFRRRFGIGHFKIFEGIKDNLGNDKPGVLLVVGGNDVPRRVMGACRAQASLIRLDIMRQYFLS